MAQRPWVIPDDVREYTQSEPVQKRTDARLEMDISRAEAYVISYCNNRFADDALYPVVPPDVRTAVILVAEMFARNAEAVSSGHGLYKSETMDDYSYTAAETQTQLDNSVLGPLLDQYVTAKIRRGVRMDMHVC